MLAMKSTTQFDDTFWRRALCHTANNERVHLTHCDTTNVCHKNVLRLELNRYRECAGQGLSFFIQLGPPNFDLSSKTFRYNSSPPLTSASLIHKHPLDFQISTCRHHQNPPICPHHQNPRPATPCSSLPGWVTRMILPGCGVPATNPPWEKW